MPPQQPLFARCLAVVSTLLLLAPLCGSHLLAQETEDPNRTCFMCHGDPENFSGREGGERLIVTPRRVRELRALQHRHDVPDLSHRLHLPAPGRIRARWLRALPRQCRQ